MYLPWRRHRAQPSLPGIPGKAGSQAGDVQDENQGWILHPTSKGKGMTLCWVTAPRRRGCVPVLVCGCHGLATPPQHTNGEKPGLAMSASEHPQALLHSNRSAVMEAQAPKQEVSLQGLVFPVLRWTRRHRCTECPPQTLPLQEMLVLWHLPQRKKHFLLSQITGDFNF